MTTRGNTQRKIDIELPPVQLSPTAQRRRLRIWSGPCIIQEQLTLFPEPPVLCLPLLTLGSGRRWLDSGLLREPRAAGPCRQRPASAGIVGKQR